MPMQLLIPDGVDIDLAHLASQGVQVDHLTATRLDVGPEVITDPGFDKLTPLFEDSETGRVSGHIASKNVCHTGLKGVCVTAPMSRRDWIPFDRYDLVANADGGVTAVGRLTYGGGHCGPGTYAHAILHHDRLVATALGAVGEDDHGIWFSGMRHHLVADSTFRQAISMPHSGDWRRFAGHLELTETLAVDDPGYPVEGQLVASADGVMAFDYLVAAGIVTPDTAGCGCKHAVDPAALDSITAGLVLKEPAGPIEGQGIIFRSSDWMFDGKIRGADGDLWVLVPVVDGDARYSERVAVSPSDCTVSDKRWVWEPDSADRADAPAVAAG